MFLNLEIYEMSEKKPYHQSTLLSGDSLASLSVLPGSKVAQKMTVTSGLKCLELFQNSSQLGLLAKMFLASSIYSSTKRFLTWKPKATPAKRLIFQLAVSMPRTKEAESLLLPTPSAQPPGWKVGGKVEVVDKHGSPPKHPNQRFYNKSSGRVVQKGLRQIIDMEFWATPRSSSAMQCNISQNRADDKKVYLENQVSRKFFPTPAAADNRDRGGPKDAAIQRRMKIGKSIELSMLVDGKLNPQWVEWLMGFPTDFTKID